MADSLTATDAVDAPESASAALEAPTPAPVEDNPTAVDTEAPVDENDAPASAPSRMEGGPDVSPVHPLAAIKADARSRALRSLAQGAIAAVLAQVWLVVYPLAVQFQLGKPVHLDWQAEATAVGGAALYGLVSYLHKALGIGEK